jgi:phage portal protein BeeE
MDQQGAISYGPSKQLMFLGLPLDYKDVIQFISPIQALTTVAPRAIDTALKLEQAANRNAVAVQPSGVLKQLSGQPLSSEELAQMAQAFNVARMTNSVAALSENLSYTETSATPDKMLLSEARNFQALEMSRLANIPGFLCNLSIGGYNYSNNADARQQLWLFACKAYATCISETLSSDNVLPRGTYVRLNPKAYLMADYTGSYGEDMPEEMPAITETVRVPLS